MSSEKFPIEFKKCPICKGEDTVARLSCEDEPSIPKGAFASLEKVAVPIQDMNKLTTLMVKTLIVHYDICVHCGTRYCTKAEIINMPVTIQHRSGSAFKVLGGDGGK